MSGLIRNGGLDPDSMSAVVGGEWLVRPRPESGVAGASIDTRTLRTGNIFWALRGTRTDGHAFLPQACAAGASVAIVEDSLELIPTSREEIAGMGVLRVASASSALRELAHAYRSAFGAVRVIGVTGSNGKTTTVRLIHAALSGAGLVGTHAQKSQNNDLGVPLTMLNARPSDDYLICEIGTSAPGEIAALTALARPDIGVITSIGRAHVELLGSIAGIADEKANLVRGIQSDGVGVVPGGCSELDAALATGVGCTLVRVGPLDSGVPVTSIRTGADGTEFDTLGHRVRVPLPGAHNAGNAAMALAVSRAVGCDLDLAIRGLASARGPSMRLEPFDIPVDGGVVRVVNDAYNANPESVRAAVGMLAAGGLDPSDQRRDLPHGRRIAVLGDMLELGTITDAAHREICELVASSSGIDLGVFIGGAFAGAMDSAMDNRAASIRLVREDPGWPDVVADLLSPGDIVLLKGSRGMRLERLIDRLRGETLVTPDR